MVFQKTKIQGTKVPCDRDRQLAGIASFYASFYDFVMLLPGAEKFLNKSSFDIWKEQLANDRFILSQVDAAILSFTKYTIEENGISEYTIDTGQDRQTVKRDNLQSLYSWRQRLICEIAQLERSLGLNGCAARRIIPGY